MTIEKAIAASIEPLVEHLVDIEKRVEHIERQPGPPGEKGEQGNDGKDGRDGIDGTNGQDGQHGAGIMAPRWEAEKGYNAGECVEWNLGQFFIATEPNSNAEPGNSKFWKRLGLMGLRYTGGFDAERKYEAGDLYVKDFATFIVIDSGEAKLLVPAPRVDKATGAIVVNEDGHGEVVTKYGNKIEFDFTNLIGRIKEETADVMATDVKRMLADMDRAKDSTSQAVEKALKQQETVLFEAVIGLVEDSAKGMRAQIEALQAEVAALKGA